MPSHDTNPPVAQEPHYPLARAAFFGAAAVLGSASIALSAAYAASRGVDAVSAIVWGTVGAALAGALLVAPSEAVAAARRRDRASALACTMLAAICAVFVLTGALGNASAGRQSAARDHALVFCNQRASWPLRPVAVGS